MVKWIDLSEKEKRELIERTYESIAPDEQSVNFHKRLVRVTHVRVSERELYYWMEENVWGGS